MKSCSTAVVIAVVVLVGIAECAPTHTLKRTHLKLTVTDVSSEVSSLKAAAVDPLSEAVYGGHVPGSNHSGSGSNYAKAKAIADEKVAAMDRSWLIGIGSTIIGQTIIVIGLQLQKISHNISTPQIKDRCPPGETEDSAGEDGYYFLQPRWILGGIVFALGHIMCWLALGLAPLSILSCLQSWNIVVSMALAPILLNETLPPHAIEYATLLVIGCVVIVFFGPRADNYKFETVESLAAAFIAPTSIVVHIVCLGSLILSMTTSLLQSTLWRVERYVLMSATCAWYAALCSKSMSMMLITSVAGDGQVQKLGFWIFALCFALFALGQLHFMNLGLKYGLASAVLPLYEAVSMVGQLFFGGILFREFQNFHGSDELGFASGVLIVIISLGLLIKSNRNMEAMAMTLPSTAHASPRLQARDSVP